MRIVVRLRAIGCARIGHPLMTVRTFDHQTAMIGSNHVAAADWPVLSAFRDPPCVPTSAWERIFRGHQRPCIDSPVDLLAEELIFIIFSEGFSAGLASCRPAMVFFRRHLLNLMGDIAVMRVDDISFPNIELGVAVVTRRRALLRAFRAFRECPRNSKVWQVDPRRD